MNRFLLIYRTDLRKAQPQVQPLSRHQHCRCVMVTHPDGSQEIQTAGDACSDCLSEADKFNAAQAGKRAMRGIRGQQEEE